MRHVRRLVASANHVIVPEINLLNSSYSGKSMSTSIAARNEENTVHELFTSSWMFRQSKWKENRALVTSSDSPCLRDYHNSSKRLFGNVSLDVTNCQKHLNDRIFLHRSSATEQHDHIVKI
jgi:hypothetical protein